MNNNQAGSGEMVVFAFGIAAIWIALKLVMVLACLFALGVTILCIIAWKRPLRWDEVTLEPEEAHGIVCIGVLGAFGFFVVMTLFAVVSPLHFKDDDYLSFIVAGYSMGVIVVSFQERALPASSNPTDYEILPPARTSYEEMLKRYDAPSPSPYSWQEMAKLYPAPPPPAPAPPSPSRPHAKKRSFDFADWED